MCGGRSSNEKKVPTQALFLAYHNCWNGRTPKFEAKMSDYFTPISGVAGGSLVGLSAASLLLFNGDVLGASCLISSTFTNPQKTLQDPSQVWKFVLLAAFLLTSTYVLGPEFSIDIRTNTDPSIPTLSPFAYALAGLLVGFGTKLGNGCTSGRSNDVFCRIFVVFGRIHSLISVATCLPACNGLGHGVCGLGRSSPRSFAAVMTFMMSAIATVAVSAPDSFLADYTSILRAESPVELNPGLGGKFTTAVVCVAILDYYHVSRKVSPAQDKLKLFASALVGVLFASGLAISQMVVGSKLYGFLNVGSITTGGWDPTLATVLGTAVPISFVAYQFVEGFTWFPTMGNRKRLSKPMLASKFSVPTNRRIDSNLIIGSAIFGVGWGIGLVCPGPALYLAAVGNTDILFRWMPSFIVGSALAKRAKGQDFSVGS